MEREAYAMFKYPNLYSPQILINGLNEVSIPIITMEEADVVSWAIWGLLPSGYKDDWELFQSLTNTLNIHIDTLDSDLWYADAINERRCLIPLTGFFTSLLKNGEISPYYIGAKDRGLLYLAGIYTVLEDGFITCALLTGPLDKHLAKYQNLVNFMPIILNQQNKAAWLEHGTTSKRIKETLNSSNNINLEANAIAKGLFNQDITYNSMLTPHEYTDY